MDLFPKLAELEYEDIDTFFNVTPRPEEDLNLEFKRMLPKAKNHDLAEEMVAFANKEGGWIFIGVDEDDNRRAIWPPAGIFKGRKEKIHDQTGIPVDKERIDIIIRQYVHPEINYELRILDKPKNEPGDIAKVIVIIHIPKSPESPHVTYRRLGVPIRYRTGKELKPIPFDLLDLLRDNVTKSEESLDELVQSSRERTLKTVNNQKPWIHTTLIPNNYKTNKHQIRDLNSVFNDASVKFRAPKRRSNMLKTVQPFMYGKLKTTAGSVQYYFESDIFPHVAEMTTNGQISFTSNPITVRETVNQSEEIIANDYLILSVIWPILVASKINAEIQNDYNLILTMDNFNDFQFGIRYEIGFPLTDQLEIIQQPTVIDKFFKPSLSLHSLNALSETLGVGLSYAIGFPSFTRRFVELMNSYFKLGVAGYEGRKNETKNSNT